MKLPDWLAGPGPQWVVMPCDYYIFVTYKLRMKRVGVYIRKILSLQQTKKNTEKKKWKTKCLVD